MMRWYFNDWKVLGRSRNLEKLKFNFVNGIKTKDCGRIFCSSTPVCGERWADRFVLVLRVHLQPPPACIIGVLPSFPRSVFSWSSRWTTQVWHPPSNQHSSSLYLKLISVKIFLLVTLATLVLSKPWYQGDGLPDCAPGKCPKTAEVSPIKCSSDPAMFFNNGYPTLCAEGFTCDAAAADAGEGNPCRAAEEAEEGYE